MSDIEAKKIPGKVHEIKSDQEFRDLITNNSDKGVVILDAFAEW